MRHGERRRGELGDSDQDGGPASVQKLVARTNAAAWPLLLTKCRLLTESVIDLRFVCVITRVRCVDGAETQGWHYLALYDDDVAVRALLAGTCVYQVGRGHFSHSHLCRCWRALL